MFMKYSASKIIHDVASVIIYIIMFHASLKSKLNKSKYTFYYISANSITDSIITMYFHVHNPHEIY